MIFITYFITYPDYIVVSFFQVCDTRLQNFSTHQGYYFHTFLSLLVIVLA